MKKQIKTLVKFFKSTWLIILITALLCALILQLLPTALKNFMDKF